jgi:hypothetical protein
LEGELDLSPDPDHGQSELKLKLSTGTKLEVAFKPASLPQAAEGRVWAINGALDTPTAGGLSATFSLMLDLFRRQVGPVRVRLKELDLGQAREFLSDAGIERPAGRVKDLEINLEPYSLRSLAVDKTWESNCFFEGVQFACPYVHAKGMTGQGHLRAASSNGSMELNAILRLQTFGELVCGKEFTVQAGRDGFLHFVGKYKAGEKGPEVRLEELEAKLGAFSADIKGDPNHVVTWEELLARLKNGR